MEGWQPKLAELLACHLEEEKSICERWLQQVHNVMLLEFGKFSQRQDEWNRTLMDSLSKHQVQRLELLPVPSKCGMEVESSAATAAEEEEEEKEEEGCCTAGKTKFGHRFSRENLNTHSKLYRGLIVDHTLRGRDWIEKFRDAIGEATHIHRSCGPPECFKAFVHSKLFSWMSTFFTLMFVIVVGIEADLGVRAALRDDETPQWIVTAAFWCNVCYAVEVSLCVAADGLLYFVGHNCGWNWLDFGLMSFSVLDLAGVAQSLAFLRVAKVTKLLKAFRVLRVLRYFSELRLLLTSLLQSMASLCWSLALLVIMTYLVAIAFTQGAASHLANPGTDITSVKDIAYYYPDMMTAMYSLIASITGGQDWRPASDTVWKIGNGYGVFFLVYVLTMVMGLMNVITGVFVEHASNVVQIDREYAIVKHMMQVEKDVEESLLLFRELDTENQGKIPADVLREFLAQPRINSYFWTFDLDVADEEMVKLFDTDDDGMVGKKEFVLACVSLRGDAKKAELRLSSWSTTMHLSHIESMLIDTMNMLEKYQKRVADKRRISSKSSLKRHDESPAFENSSKLDYANRSTSHVNKTFEF